MTDIVDRLHSSFPSIPAMRDAANEIERLRTAVARDREDAARWRAYRSEWFAIGTHSYDDPVRYALRAMTVAGDLQSLDAAADQLIAARAAKEHS